MTDTSRAVVITGAAGDLGRELCGSFPRRRLHRLCGRSGANPPRPGLEAVMLDVTDRAAVIALAERAGRERQVAGLDQRRRRLSRLPGAGSRRPRTGSALSRSISPAHFYGCAAALPVLAAAGGGRIVNIGSISGQVGGVGAHPAYGASKAGVHALTKDLCVGRRALRRSLQRRGARAAWPAEWCASSAKPSGKSWRVPPRCGAWAPWRRSPMSSAFSPIPAIPT